LFLGTQADNIADMLTKHRHKPAIAVRGAAHGNTRLTESEVRAIRRATGSHASVGLAFGVSQTHVSDIKAGRKWGHLSD